MSVRDKLGERARPYLKSGEQIQSVFIAMSGPSPYWSFFVPIINMAFSPYHEIVVTSRGIVVLDTTKWFSIKPKRQRLRHSRDFSFGQMKGLYGSFVLDDTKYWVHRRFHKDVAAADAALAQPTSAR